MKNIKKLLLLVLAFTLVFSLASCSLIDKITGKDDDNDKVCKHEDDDGDCYCDKCDEAMHEDEDEDGYCDYCDEELDKKGGNESESEIELILDGEATFQIVLDKTISYNTKRQIEELLVNPFSEFDVEVTLVVEDSEDDEYEEDIEILIGQVKNRGEDYEYDKHSLGKNGYAFKIVDSKVLIAAGSEDKLVEAVEEFAEYVLLLGEDVLEDVTMTSSDEVEEIQDDYRITALTIDGVDMRDYTIAVDRSNEYLLGGALAFQDSIYSRTGYWFEIVDFSEADDESVIFKTKNKVYGADDGFRIYTQGSRLIVECAFENMCDRAVTRFITSEILSAPEGEFAFEGEMYKQDISFVTYEDFGAKGDGRTDDFQAIYDTHVFANISGQTVKAKNGARYYIFYVPETAPICTNVDWGTAEFIIDDRDIPLYKEDKNYSQYGSMGGRSIFTVMPDSEHRGITINDYDFLAEVVKSGVNPTTTKINFKLDGWDGDLMLVFYNNSHKVYRRKGYSSFMGLDAHEVVVIDKNGNLRSDTPIMFDYPNLSKIVAYKIDKNEAVTVEGGVFTNKVCQRNIMQLNLETGKYEYREGTPALSRNINVQRSYTLVKNVKHYVADELTVREQFDENDDIVNGLCPYYGFFTTDFATDVTFEDCVLTGRRAYARPGGGTGGTYDIELWDSNMIRFVNCVQSNFWITIDSNYNITVATKDTPGAVPNMAFVSYGTKKKTTIQVFWGIGGTNFSKNVQYIGSTLTRFDAHAGLYNGLIKDSTVTGISITGNGKMIIENSTYYAPKDTSTYNSLVSLRADYGATWAGDVEIKDVTAYMYTSGSDYSGIFIANHSYMNWYYGYMAKFPNISIDNLDFYDISTKQPLPENFEVVLCKMELKPSQEGYIAPNKNKMHLTESHLQTVIPIYDGNKDGKIDELPFDLDGDGVVDAPIDIDGNGVAGETDLNYKATWDAEFAIGKHENGIQLSTFRNVNIIQPPEYIKIVNNDGKDGSGGYKFLVAKTDGGGTSNGGWYGIEENYGGFFGCTKFIFGEGEGDFVIGTENPDGVDTKAFSFVVSTLR